MKKVLTSCVIVTILLLTGCGNQSAESTVKELLQAGIDRDYETLYDYFSYYYEGDLDEYDLEDMSDSITQVVREVGGIKNVEIKEVNRKEMNVELVEEMDDFYGNDWYVTLVRLPGVEDDTSAFFK